MDWLLLEGPSVSPSWNDIHDMGPYGFGDEPNRVSSIGYPQTGFPANSHYKIIRLSTLDITERSIDTGRDEVFAPNYSGDYWDVSPEWHFDKNKCAAVIDLLTNTIRTANMNFATPQSADDCWSFPWGTDQKCGDSEFTVKLLYSRINTSGNYASWVIRHTQHNDFRSVIGLHFVSDSS